MSARKAVVMAAGRGSRMQRPGAPEAADALSVAQERAASKGAKAMMPLGGIDERPFLDFVLSGLADAGVEDVCIVVARGESAMRNRYMGGVSVSRLRLCFAEQAEPRGTADAVCSAKEFAGEDQFLVLNADNYYPVSALRGVMAIDGAGLAAFEARTLIEQSNIPRDRLRSFALLRANAGGELRDIIEKPGTSRSGEIADTALISMNLWSFTPAIFAACERIVPSPRGELELADAVRVAMRDLNVRFSVVKFAAGVLDLSNRADVPVVAERLSRVDVSL